MTTNLPWKASLPFAVFFQQGKTEERWKRLLDRHSIRFPKYSALSFDRLNFFTDMANLFLLSRKAFVMCYCFRAPIKTFFFDACQMTIKSCQPPNRKKPYNKHLIQPRCFDPYCKLRILVYFHRFMACVLRAWAINRREKTRSVIYSTTQLVVIV